MFWNFHAEVKNIKYWEYSHTVQNFPVSNSKPKIPLASVVFLLFSRMFKCQIQTGLILHQGYVPEKRRANGSQAN